MSASRAKHHFQSPYRSGPGNASVRASRPDHNRAGRSDNAGLIVAKARSGNHAKPDIGETRSVAVAVLEAEIDHPANHEGEQVRVGIQCGRSRLGQNIESRQRMPGRSSRAGRRDPRSRGSRAVDHIRSYSCRDLLLGRMRRPVDAQTAGGSRGRRQWRDCSDRRSCTAPRAGTRRSARSTVVAARGESTFSRCSASASAPVRNSHSARWNSSEKSSS